MQSLANNAINKAAKIVNSVRLPLKCMIASATTLIPMSVRCASTSFGRSKIAMDVYVEHGSVSGRPAFAASARSVMISLGINTKGHSTITISISIRSALATQNTKLEIIFANLIGLPSFHAASSTFSTNYAWISTFKTWAHPKKLAQCADNRLKLQKVRGTFEILANTKKQLTMYGGCFMLL